VCTTFADWPRRRHNWRLCNSGRRGGAGVRAAQVCGRPAHLRRRQQVTVAVDAASMCTPRLAAGRCRLQRDGRGGWGGEQAAERRVHCQHAQRQAHAIFEQRRQARRRTTSRARAPPARWHRGLRHRSIFLPVRQQKALRWSVLVDTICACSHDCSQKVAQTCTGGGTIISFPLIKVQSIKACSLSSSSAAAAVTSSSTTPGSAGAASHFCFL